MKLTKILNSNGRILQPKFSIAQIALAWLGGSLAIAAVATLSLFSGLSWILGSFGASCVLLFGFPDAPFSQPRNLIAGHLLASTIGLSYFTLVGPEWWSMALAVGTALAVMMATRTVHPPAGSNPVIIFLTQPDWMFLLYPTLAGALVLLLIALCYLKLTRRISNRYAPVK